MGMLDVARRDHDSQRTTSQITQPWPGRPIIPDPNGDQHPVPGHDLTRFYALLPLLAVLAAIDPAAFQAVAEALGMLAAIRQLP